MSQSVREALEQLRRTGRSWLTVTRDAEGIIAKAMPEHPELGVLREALRDAVAGCGGTLGTPQEILDLVEKVLAGDSR